MGTDLQGKALPYGITQRKDGSYQARFTDRLGKRRNIYGKDLKKLQKSLNEAIYEDEHGFNGDASTVTVDKWIAVWLEKYKRNVRNTTLKSYKSYSQIISSELGSMQISSVKPIHILDLVNHMRENNYKTGTIKGAKTIAYNLFQKAYENDLIKKNPVAGMVIMGEDDKKIRVLSVKEQEIFLLEVETSWYCELFNILLLTGLRIGEAFALTWNNVNLDKGEIYVNGNVVHVPVNGKYVYELHQPKTKSGRRMIPLCPEAIYVFEKQKVKTKGLKRIHGEFGNLVFTGRNGEMVSSSNIRRILRTKIKTINKKYNMNIQEISPHVLRHTFATRMYESGIELKTISIILGHAKIETTANIYTHVLPDNLAKEMEKFQVIKAKKGVI